MISNLCVRNDLRTAPILPFSLLSLPRHPFEPEIQEKCLVSLSPEVLRSHVCVTVPVLVRRFQVR